MEFRTEIKPLSGMTGMLRHGVPVLLMGSCFTDNIGSCLASQLFEVEINPFGPLYNPLSISRAVEILVNQTEVRAEEIFEHEGRYHSFLFHSRYSGVIDVEATLSVMNRKIREAADVLRNAGVVILTLGTTKVYRFVETGEVVANCHKLQPSVFSANNLDLDETVDALERIVSAIRSINPNAHIVFTVSPLRYLGDGAHNSQIAKATLLLAVERLISGYTDVGYFPSYEIMMDDLRDYRFYAEDMRHPSEVAVKYIYEIFSDSYFDRDTKLIAAEAARLTRRLAHRSFNISDSEDNERRNALAEAFLTKYPKLRQAYKRYIINGI
ncbi:MAG: GSCFA domain-containing protein [Duncaniella sp.]|nr:GSCFA domain-containing protein [Duncaniella sp.]